MNTLNKLRKQILESQDDYSLEAKAVIGMLLNVVAKQRGYIDFVLKYFKPSCIDDKTKCVCEGPNWNPDIPDPGHIEPECYFYSGGTRLNKETDKLLEDLVV